MGPMGGQDRDKGPLPDPRQAPKGAPHARAQGTPPRTGAEAAALVPKRGYATPSRPRNGSPNTPSRTQAHAIATASPGAAQRRGAQPPTAGARNPVTGATRRAVQPKPGAAMSRQAVRGQAEEAVPSRVPPARVGPGTPTRREQAGGLPVSSKLGGAAQGPSPLQRQRANLGVEKPKATASGLAGAASGLAPAGAPGTARSARARGPSPAPARQGPGAHGVAGARRPEQSPRVRQDMVAVQRTAAEPRTAALGTKAAKFGEQARLKLAPQAAPPQTAAIKGPGATRHEHLAGSAAQRASPTSPLEDMGPVLRGALAACAGAEASPASSLETDGSVDSSAQESSEGARVRHMEDGPAGLGGAEEAALALAQMGPGSSIPASVLQLMRTGHSQALQSTLDLEIEVLVSPRSPLQPSLLDNPFVARPYLSPIGEGASGTVYRMQHQGFPTPTAVKFMHVSSPSEAQRVRREFLVMERLGAQCGNVLRPHYLQWCGPVFCLCMPLCAGSLWDYVDLRAQGLRGARGGKLSGLPWNEALGILEQAARGLKHCHALDVCHSDIKPENLLIVGRPKGAAWEPRSLTLARDTVKLTDFGLAVSLVDQKEIELLGWTPGGTEGWMAPEVERKRKGMRGGYFGKESDIFSLGLVLYFMLTASTVEEDAPADEPGKVCLSGWKWREVPLSVKTLLRRMLSEDHRKRPSAHELTLLLEAGSKQFQAHKAGWK